VAKPSPNRNQNTFSRANSRLWRLICIRIAHRYSDGYGAKIQIHGSGPDTNAACICAINIISAKRSLGQNAEVVVAICISKTRETI